MNKNCQRIIFMLVVFVALGVCDKAQATYFVATYDDLGFTTNSLKYQPGDTVYFKTESALSADKYYKFAILSPEGVRSYVGTCTAGSDNSQKGSYKLADNATQGSGWNVEIHEFSAADCSGASSSDAVTFLVKDESGPIVTSFSATPTTINTDIPSSRTVAATFTVSDPSGVNIDNSDCQLNSETTYQRYNGIITATDIPNQYTCVFNFGSLSEQGKWDFNLYFQDNLHNGSNYNSYQSQSGIKLNEVPGAQGTIIENESTFKLESVAPPVLTGFSVDKAEFDTSVFAQTITASMTITSQDGINSDMEDGAICTLNSDTTNQRAWGVLRAVSGETNNYTCAVILPAFSATGNWYFGINDIADNFENFVNYRYNNNYQYNQEPISGISVILPSAIARITNIAAPESADKTGPTLTEFSAPVTFDVSTDPQTITATYKVSDPAGLNDDSMQCSLNSTTTSQSYRGGTYNDTIIKNGDQYTCTFTLPVGSATGDWNFQLNFADSFWNNSNYDASRIDGDTTGFDPNTKSWPVSHLGAVVTNGALTSDETGPMLIDFSATPNPINTDNHSRKIVAIFTTSEPLKTQYENSCELLGDSQYAIPTQLTHISGNQYMCEATLPTHSAGGRWDFVLYLQDTLGNTTQYHSFLDSNLNNQWALAFPGTDTGFITNEGTSTIKQIATSGGGTTTVNAETTEALIIDSSQSATIAVEKGVGNATVNVSSLVDDNGTGTLPQISIASDSAQVNISNQTTVISKDPNWNGIISAPVAIIVDVPGVSSVDAAIEVGSTNTNLSFDKAVRILLPNQAGKRAGFKQVGGDFTEITNICTFDSQNSGDLARKDGGCKIDVDGDLVIWTSHFSEYAAYSQSQAPATHTLSGTIKYYDGIKTISNATVTLKDDNDTEITTTTDSNGVYQFTAVPDGGNYVVSVGKDDNFSPTGVTVSDLIAIKKHTLGIELTDIYKKIAADFNSNSSISVSDLIMLKKFTLGQVAGRPTSSWKFYSSDAALTEDNYLTEGLTRTYTNLSADTPNQDFIGIKMGDVSASWSNN